MNGDGKFMTFVATFVVLITVFSTTCVQCSSLDLVKVFELPICCYTFPNSITEAGTGNNHQHQHHHHFVPPTHNGGHRNHNQGPDGGFETVLATAASSVQKTVQLQSSKSASATEPEPSPSTSNSSMLFDSSRFYKLIVPFPPASVVPRHTKTSTSKHVMMKPLRRKREAVQKPEEITGAGVNEADAEVEAENRSINIFNDFDSIYTPLANAAATVQLPSNWLTKLQSALFQSMIMQNGTMTVNSSLTSNNPEGYGHGYSSQEAASSNSNARSFSSLPTLVPEDFGKNSNTLWQKIANASVEIIEPYTKKVLTALPGFISGKMTGVMVNNQNGIQLHMSATSAPASNQARRSINAEAHIESSRAARQSRYGTGTHAHSDSVGCDCHLIHHGDIPLAYWSVQHTQNEAGNDQLEYLVFPVTQNVPTPPRIHKFVSNDLTVIHRPSEVDYTSEIMKMNYKNKNRVKNQKSRRQNYKKNSFISSRSPDQESQEWQPYPPLPQEAHIPDADESMPPKGAYPSVPDILREMQPYTSLRAGPQYQDRLATPYPYDYDYDTNSQQYSSGTEPSPSYFNAYYASPNYETQKSSVEHSSHSQQIHPSPLGGGGGAFQFYHQQQIVHPPTPNGLDQVLIPDAHVPPPPVFLPAPHRFLLNPFPPHPHPHPHPAFLPNLGHPQGLHLLPFPFHPQGLPPPVLPPQLPLPHPPPPHSNLVDAFGGSAPGQGQGQFPFYGQDYPKSIQEIISSPHPHRLQLPFPYNATRGQGQGERFQNLNDYGFDECRQYSHMLYGYPDDDAPTTTDTQGQGQGHWGSVNAKRRRMIPTSALAASMATATKLHKCREKYIRSQYSNYKGKSNSKSSLRFPKDDNNNQNSGNDNEVLGSNPGSL